jgi:uncharacterized protein YbaR (Trm112 family)
MPASARCVRSRRLTSSARSTSSCASRILSRASGCAEPQLGVSRDIRTRELLKALACPRCRGALRPGDPQDASLACAHCGARYPSRVGIPILLPPKLLSAKERSDPPTHKERQIAFFDQDSVDDFRVTRPRGGPSSTGGSSERSSGAASSASRTSCPGRRPSRSAQDRASTPSIWRGRERA